MTARRKGATTRHCADHADYARGCEGCRQVTRTYHKRREAKLIRSGQVDATGTTRRLQALAWMGWTTVELGRRLGRPQQMIALWMDHGRVVVVARTHDDVAALYDQISMTHGGNGLAHNRAVAHGWCPPLAWDDDTIDLPDARPDYGSHTRDDALLEDVEYLIRTGATMHSAAMRLGTTPESLERQLYRSGRGDLARTLMAAVAA